MLNDAQIELLRQSLLAIPLSAEDAEKAMHALSKNVDFIRRVSADSPFWDFAEKTAETSRRLGILHADFIKAALKQPSLFYQSPETINTNIEGTAQLVGVDKASYVKAALKQPSLFCRSPETISANIEGAAQLLGVDKVLYVYAALKRSSLFYQSPETINANIEGTARLVGVDKASYVKAALKQPPLFYQSPETIARNARYIQEESRKSIKTKNILEDMIVFPASFSCAPANTKLRSIHAAVCGKKFTLSGFYCSHTKVMVEGEIVEHFRDLFNRTGKGVRTMQVLAEAGIISKLPDWVPVPSEPLRQRIRSPQP